MFGKLPKVWTAVAVGLSTLVTLYLSVASWKAHAGLKASAERTPVRGLTPIVSLDELYANVSSPRDGRAHLVAMKLDLELFDESSRELIDKAQGIVRNAILMSALEQEYDWLNTMPGKLFFKERLVTKINQAFNGAVVRDVHFSSFYLR